MYGVWLPLWYQQTFLKITTTYWKMKEPIPSCSIIWRRVDWNNLFYMCMVNTNNASHFEDCLRVFNVFLFHFYMYFLGVAANYLDVYICYICCYCMSPFILGGPSWTRSMVVGLLHTIYNVINLALYKHLSNNSLV